MPKAHLLPPFLDQIIEPSIYSDWLESMAKQHAKRDRRRGHDKATAKRSLYKIAIHEAVLLSQGKDAYTGEPLHWNLLGTWNNEDAKSGKHAYKTSFDLMPTVDHTTADATQASFKICSWRTNDSKHSLSIETFLELCAMTLRHNGYRVEKIE